MDFLNGARKRLSQDVGATYPLLTQVIEKLRRQVSEEDWGRAEDLLARHSIDLFGLWAVSTMRGERDLPQAPFQEYEPEPATGEARRIEVHPEGLALVLPGPHNINFMFARYPPVHLWTLANLAVGLALVIQDRKKAELLTAVDALRRQLERWEVAARELQALVESELSPHRRLLVEGVLGNAGRTAYAAATHAKLVVATRGYRTGSEVIQEDVEVPTRLRALPRDDETASQTPVGSSTAATPLLIGPGQSLRFRCVTRSTLKEEQYGRELLQAFDAGQHHAYLAVGLIKATKGSTLRDTRRASHTGTWRNTSGCLRGGSSAS